MAVRTAYLVLHKKRFRWGRELLLLLFMLFHIALATLVFKPHSAWARVRAGRSLWEYATWRLRTMNDVNFTPMVTIRRFTRLGWGDAFAVNLVGNVGMFLPLGFGLPLLWRRWQRVWKVLLMAFLVPVVIETTQIFIGRSVDIDDVLLNAAGVMMGYVLWAICRVKTVSE